MRPHNSYFAALSAVLILAPISVPAFQANGTPVTIIVSDVTGARITNAQIRIAPPPDPEPTKMETNSEGILSLSLKPGGYSISVSCAGFISITMHFDVSRSKEVQTIPAVLQVARLHGMEVSSDPSSGSNNVLTLSSYAHNGDLKLSAADFKSLPHTSITVHNPHTNADETYSGVALADLLAKLNVPLGPDLRGKALENYLVATGADGYKVVLALAELDPTFHPGEVLVADAMNGQPLDAHSGPFKLIVTEDKRPARWVRNLTFLELRSIDN